MCNRVNRYNPCSMQKGNTGTLTLRPERWRTAHIAQSVDTVNALVHLCQQSAALPGLLRIILCLLQMAAYKRVSLRKCVLELLELGAFPTLLVIIAVHLNNRCSGVARGLRSDAWLPRPSAQHMPASKCHRELTGRTNARVCRHRGDRPVHTEYDAMCARLLPPRGPAAAHRRFLASKAASLSALRTSSTKTA